MGGEEVGNKGKGTAFGGEEHSTNMSDGVGNEEKNTMGGRR